MAEFDNSLREWSEIEHLHGWNTLLVGNGLSTNVYPNFAYDSLYQKVQSGTRFGRLTDEDKRLFEALNTQNFEVVLADLATTIRVAEATGQTADSYYERYRTVQAALGAAVRAVHITGGEVAEETLKKIGNVISAYNCVFSTSYDLILYWAMAAVGFEKFFDALWWNYRNEFDPEHCIPKAGRTCVYFAHGALHLIVEGSGTVRKLTADAKTLLDKIGQPIDEDPKARPLLITEGSHHDKVRAIEGNPYLSHVRERLKDGYGPLVIFGHSLGDQDQHLIDAINANPDRPVAVSIRRNGRRRRIKERKHYIAGKLETEELHFFESRTHLLGAEELTVSETPWRQFISKVPGVSVATDRSAAA